VTEDDNGATINQLEVIKTARDVAGKATDIKEKLKVTTMDTEIDLVNE